MRRFVVLGLAVLSSALGVDGAIAANLIRNGNFEGPLVPVGSYTLFNVGQRISLYWRVIGASGNVGVVSGQLTQGGFTFPARAGAQWLDLTGISNSATGVSQRVATVAGTAYDLNFYVGSVVNPGGIFGVSSKINVSINGAPLISATNSAGAGSTTMVWRRFSSTFTATGAVTTIAFVNADPANDTLCALDGVSLVPHPAASPSPALEPGLFELGPK